MSQERDPEGSGSDRKRENNRFDRRCRRRLREDLGVNPAGVEVILHLRLQILDLQARLQEMEAEIAERRSGRSARLTRYQEVYYEATWYDLDFSEDNE